MRVKTSPKSWVDGIVESVEFGFFKFAGRSVKVVWHVVLKTPSGNLREFNVASLPR